jgi:ABC-type antimicrobial peptide transport system permease subunit
MFHARYVFGELRRRLGRTILTALGLAAGVGLVIGIIGVSDGLDKAQNQVLSPLSNVGTDVLVTRVAGMAASDGSATATTTTSTTQAAQGPGRNGGGNGGGGGGGGGGFFGGPANAALNQADSAALLSDNDTVLTDLSKLGPAGTKFTHDFFLPATLLTFPDASVAEVAKVRGVTSAVGGLTLLVQRSSGTVPNISVDVTAGEQQIQQTIRPEPLTAEERQAQRDCLAAKGVTFGRGGGGAGGGTTASSTPTSTPTSRGATPTTTAPAPDPGPPDFDNQAFQDCLPARMKEFQNNVVIPARTIQQIVNPPQTDTTATTYTAAGVDPTSPKSGVVTAEQVKTGRFLEASTPDEVMLSVAYANKKSLAVGQTLAVNGTSYPIVGLVDPALTGSTADVYFPLATLQTLSGKTGRVNQVFVKTSDSGNVDAAAKQISGVLPGAQVVTTKALAAQVTGSLADAKKLAARLGGALTVIVLAAVFIIALLLTLSSVAKRVREIGTLRAIGWSKGMVVRQILSETVAISVLGGVIGVAVGFGVAALVAAFSPELSATSSGVPSFGSSSLSSFFGSTASQSAASTTRAVHLTAPVGLTTVLIGVGFAILGGVLAGAIGGWRAARLSPAEALRNLG